MVRLLRPLKLASVHGDRWTVRLGISIDVRCLAWRVGFCPCRAGDRDEFHIEPTLTALVFGDKGLRLFQATGEGVLGAGIMQILLVGKGSITKL